MLNALLFPTIIVLKMHFRRFYIVDIFVGFSLTVSLAISHAYFEYLFADYGSIFYAIYPPFAALSIFLLFPMMALVALYTEILWNLLEITKPFGIPDGVLRNKLIGWINKRK